jgi:hypothetical protein
LIIILVTATRLPPSWVAIDPQKFSAATTRSGLAGAASVGVTEVLVAVGARLAAVGTTLFVVGGTAVAADRATGGVGGAVVGEDATAVGVGEAVAPLQATVKSVMPTRSTRPRTRKADGR